MTQSDNRQSDNRARSLISHGVRLVGPLIVNQPGAAAPCLRQGGSPPPGGGFAGARACLCPCLRDFNPSGDFGRGYSSAPGLGDRG
jgi:hypothetical protein